MQQLWITSYFNRQIIHFQTFPEKHYKQQFLKMSMSAKEFDVNGTDYSITLTDQVIGHVNNLKNLYNAAYEDPESFEDVSSEISSTITDIASTVEPEVEDSDLDGLIQEIIKIVDNKAAEIEKELSVKEKPAKKSKK